MKELKNKEVILGLVVLIVLCVISIVLIIKREFPREINREIGAETLTMEEEAEFAFYADGNTSAVTAGDRAVTEDVQRQEEIQATTSNKAQAADAVNSKTQEESLLKEEKIESLALNTAPMQVKEFAEDPVYTEYTGEEMWQLEELYGYWKDYQLEAVDDLIRLPRVRTLTNELSDTNRFYYYGDMNADGLPHGSGLAVYADNAYYCGEWKNGKRHGTGMWLQIFPDKTAIMNEVSGVIEHIYNGQWQNDYPNGEGQEHVGYDEEKMVGSDVVTNVIGKFKDGYYDGSLYIMTFDGEGGTIDWEAEAKKGVFTYYHDRENATGALPVWREMMDSSEDVFRWLKQSENINWGISGLKKKN